MQQYIINKATQYNSNNIEKFQRVKHVTYVKHDIVGCRKSKFKRGNYN